ASITGVVDKLEQQGLVVRVPHPSDRRTVLARLTEEGRRVADEATAALNDGPFGSLPLSGDEAEQLIDVLGRLRRAAGDF
ncbi:MAG: MarR family transcriptional regulator, partial [Frankiales bacterium]|nr:MarR family transcriptional regulator [Frankiales bacterium]